MKTSQVREIADKLNEAGVPPDFGQDYSRLLIQVLRRLAKGRPITWMQVEEISHKIGVAPDDAMEFLSGVSERDAEDNIIGLIGLSLNEAWTHRFEVNGVYMRTWCAWDTLFLPLLLDRPASIESDSPASGKTVKVTVGLDGVTEYSPATAAISVVVLDLSQHDVSSVEAIWSNFCHQVYFFASREEAEGWSGNRDDVVILSVEEAYELGKHAFAGLLAHAV